MTPREVELVQHSWRRVVGVADEAAALFYSSLFVLDPRLRSLFHADMREQGQKFVTMIALAVNSLTRPDTLVPILRDLGRRHAAYGVLDEHYDTVETALLWTLDEGLGLQFTPELRRAWVAAYQTIAETMKDAARTEAGARPSAG